MARHTDFGDRGPRCGNDISDHSNAMSSVSSAEYHSNIEQDDNLINLFSGYDSCSITEPFADEDYIVGAGYLVKPLTTSQDKITKQNSARFAIEIDHWIFTHKHVFMRQAVMSFEIEINTAEPNQFRLMDVKIMMRHLDQLDSKTANNVVEAALKLMQTINEKRVPKCETVLKDFAIHPDSRINNTSEATDNLARQRSGR